jgi:hypothetical protein
MAVTPAAQNFSATLPLGLGSCWTDGSAMCFLAQDLNTSWFYRVIFPFFGGSYDELIF